MTSKECMLAALSGKTPQRFPVVTPYSHLMKCDHWTELTGKPPWTYYQWLYATPEEHLEGYRILASKLPFDWLEPVWAPSRDVVTFEERDGKHFQINTRTGTKTILSYVEEKIWAQVVLIIGIIVEFSAILLFNPLVFPKTT